MTTQDPNLSVVFQQKNSPEETHLKNANSGPRKTCLRIQRFYSGSNACLGV